MDNIRIYKNTVGQYELVVSGELVTTQSTLEKLFIKGAKYFKGQSK